MKSKAGIRQIVIMFVVLVWGMREREEENAAELGRRRSNWSKV